MVRNAGPLKASRLSAKWVSLGLAVACFIPLLVSTSTPAVAASTRGLFDTSARPKIKAVTSRRSVNLGVRFTTSTAGKITALQFYRGSKQKRAYPGSLWSASGKLLARVTFAKSSKVGWQTAKLAKPVSIKKQTTYVVSYRAANGRFATTRKAFAKAYAHEGITVARKGGVYTFGKKSVRPSHSTTSNYFVDVVFTPAALTGSITDAELRTAATKRVFFAHQSVGDNVISGVWDLYASRRLAAAPVSDITGSRSVPAGTAGLLAHAYIGENFYPVQKLADFNSILRGGVARQIDVAVLKFCFVDIGSGTDVNALFAKYTSTVASLEAAYPQTTFLYATNPLTSDIGADNVARTKFNNLIRARYSSTGQLWDIAAVESTRPDGSRVRGVSSGQPYEALYSGYTDDGGHLNAAGSKVAAAALLRLIAAQA